MWWLFFQIWVWLLASFVLGWTAHWFLCCRHCDAQDDTDSARQDATLAAASAAAASPAAPVIAKDFQPQAFTSPPAEVDDLKRIKGIGAVIEETLNGLGVYQFSQIAGWTSDNVAWVEESLSFPGRIGREDWVNQAKTLAAGGSTDFAARVDAGGVDYN